MKFKRNILGLVVLSATMVLAGQALADGTLDAPLAVTGIPATAVSAANVVTQSVGGTVSWTAANAAVNTLISTSAAAATDVKDLVAIDLQISTANAKILAAQALTAGNLIGGLTGGEIVIAQRLNLGVDATTGVYTSGTAGYLTNRAAEAAAGIVTATAQATAQAAVNSLSTGGISNSIILGLQAAALETATGVANGTVAIGSADGSLGKLAFDATAALGTVRTNAIGTASDATLLRKEADDAAAAVVTAAALITGGNGSAEMTAAASHVPGTTAGSDVTHTYDLLDVATAGRVIDIRDKTKQIVWTLGTAANATPNTGTIAELVAAIDANDMDFTATTTGTTVTLTTTNTKLGVTYTAAKVGTSTTAALAAANDVTVLSTVAAVPYEAQNLTTFDVNLAEVTLLSTNAANALATAIADATNKNAVWTAAETLEASYATSEALNLNAAGASMATVSGVLNEDAARANAATAVLEGAAATAEAITAADMSDLSTAQATLTAATATVTSAAAARDAAQAAFVASSTSANSLAYSAALTAYNTAVAAQTTATTAVTAANNVLYGTGLTAATALASQTGTNATSTTARAAVVTSQAVATGKEAFQNMQIELGITGNPASALQAGLIANGDSGALVVTAVNANFMANQGFSTDIATNTAGVATNVTNIATNTAGVATNKTGIATNTAGIATNAAAIDTFGSGIAANTTGLARVQMQMAENNDMLKSGIASALAIAGMPTAPGEGLGFSVGTGYFDGESAIAMGLTFVEGSRSYKFSLGNSGGETSASAGAAFKF